MFGISFVCLGLMLAGWVFGFAIAGCGGVGWLLLCYVAWNWLCLFSLLVYWLWWLCFVFVYYLWFNWFGWVCCVLDIVLTCGFWSLFDFSLFVALLINCCDFVIVLLWWVLTIVALYFGIVCLVSFDLGWFVCLRLFLDKVWFRVLVMVSCWFW